MMTKDLRSRIGSRIVGASALVALASVGSSCNLDPVHRSGVNSLKEERDDLYPPDSAFHRPGEPCGYCHGGKGPADGKFVLGGTIFWGPDSYEARVDNAYVRILDANKTKRCFVTNCNGNFFVRESEFAKITFPLLVSVERTVDPGQKEDTLVIRRMSSHIGREASCAVCHIQGLRDFGSPGQVRMFNTEEEFRQKNIPIAVCPPQPDFDQVALCPEDRR
jgi:hypothetical protein